MSTMRWIAVPGGRVEEVASEGVNRDVAVLRVLIVPRLLEPQLAGTPMEDWPATINQSTPVVEVERPGNPIEIISNAPRRSARTQAWRGFFANGIEVTPFQPPRGYDPPAVTKTLERVGAVTSTYRAAADRPGDAAIVRQELSTWQPPAKPTRGLRSGEPQFAKVDFHRAVSLLREHPFVLRMLGLIVELELPANDLPRSEREPHARVRVSWPESPIAVESPWTAYEYDGTTFVPHRVATSDRAWWTCPTTTSGR